jgi:hypothetical protein
VPRRRAYCSFLFHKALIVRYASMYLLAARASLCCFNAVTNLHHLIAASLARSASTSLAAAVSRRPHSLSLVYRSFTFLYLRCNARRRLVPMVARASLRLRRRRYIYRYDFFLAAHSVCLASTSPVADVAPPALIVSCRSQSRIAGCGVDTSRERGSHVAPAVLSVCHACRSLTGLVAPAVHSASTPRVSGYES